MSRPAEKKASGNSAADGEARSRLQRLDKLLGQEGLGTRSELKKAIRSGRAVVNGAVEKDPGRQISGTDEVVFDGHKVGGEQYVYYMLNKPAGVITATEDRKLRTVMDLLKEPAAAAPVLRRGLFPVGRLDRDTEGLLLITDDGKTAHRLLSPKNHVEKTYYALVTGTVTDEDIGKFAEGIEAAGEGSEEAFTALPARLQVISTESPPKKDLPDGVTEFSQTLVTICEGRFHQIKRMFSAVGKEVLYLKRLSMGPLCLDPDLEPGEFRALTDAEMRELSEAGK